MADRQKLVEALRGYAADLDGRGGLSIVTMGGAVAGDLRKALLAAADLLDGGREDRYREALEQIAWGVLVGVEASTREVLAEAEKIARAALTEPEPVAPEPETEP